MSLLRPLVAALPAVRRVSSLAPGMVTAQFQAAKVVVPVAVGSVRTFHSSGAARGFEEFYDPMGADLTVTSGRSWTPAELRRKNFDDLHKLWYVLYKERNVLLSTRMRTRRALNPVTAEEEKRYKQVKLSMAAIKRVLDERRKINAILAAEEEEAAIVV